MAPDALLSLSGGLLLAFLVSAAAARLLSRGRIRWLHVLDHPNARSLHAHPIPRTGGLAVVASLALLLTGSTFVGGPPPELAWVALAAALVAAVAFVDDRRGVARRYRLLVQLAAAAVLLAGGIGWWGLAWPGGDWILPGPLAWLLTLLYVVWMTNLYNFMDGIDGLAGGMAVLGFGALAVFGWQGGDWTFAATAAAIAAAAGGFLISNFPPARLFLGDVGSSTLGLLAAALALWGSQAGLFPLWAAWLAFSPFIVDATWTLLARLARGEAIWLPHRAHHYQRLVLAGWTHRRTTLWSYLLMAAAGASAVAAPTLAPPDQWTLIAAWGAIYGLIHAKVRLLEQGKGTPASSA